MTEISEVEDTDLAHFMEFAASKIRKTSASSSSDIADEAKKLADLHVLF